MWASAQGGTCNPANLQGSPGHNAWLPQPVGCCGNGNPEAPSWVAGVWTVAGLPVTSEPFCRCQCYAGELKGKPQLLLLGNRAFAPNLVPERGSSRVSVLHGTVVRRTGIRCLPHRSGEAGGVGRPAKSWRRDRLVPSSLSLVRSWRGEAPHAPTSLLSPNCREGEACGFFQSSPDSSPVLPHTWHLPSQLARQQWFPPASLQLTTLSNLKIAPE